MSEYSAYLVTESGTIAGVQSIFAKDDKMALQIARRLLVEARFPSVEVWDRVDRVGTVDLE